MEQKEELEQLVVIVKSNSLLGLQYRAINNRNADPDDIKKEMQKNPRSLELTLLKNRNGKSNTSIYFSYYPQFNDFIPENN